MTTPIRPLAQVLASVPTSDGAGVRLRRSIGAQRGLYLDPFLMLDEFGTDNPGDYIAGFPAHPHRGFETVTYMLDGRMQHRDHLGNVGDLGPGSVQWMTAGRGVIHSEMPLQESGRMRGFQLWINLPAREKMKPAAWRDIPAADLPLVPLADGGRIKVIAGRVEIDGQTVRGPINPDGAMATDPHYWDLHLAPGAVFEQPLPDTHTSVLYSYEGAVTVGAEGASRALPPQSAGLLGPGQTLRLQAGPQGAQLILIAGRPLREPVVQYGPFVMNTREEIERAIQDYQNGELTRAA
ncbi:MAG TPA: pirin family protein [Nevskiaceae bacterium]|nr:pirin family protein [Nevskiaceae bacterium]